MKIYAISLIKNHSDVVACNLIAAAKWADKIFVFDNGSTDGTWDIVKGLASEKIIPYKYSTVPFRDSLRLEVFETFRHELDEGDWICFKLDVDEFYWEDPRDFLAKQDDSVGLVKGLGIEFQYTQDNLKNDDEVFSTEKFEYCVIQNFEERFIRYRKRLKWNNHDSLPIHPGVTSKQMIRFAHYQYRSKAQIIKRLKDQKNAINSGFSAYWEKDLDAEWKDKIVDKSKLYKVKNLVEANAIIQTLNLRDSEGMFRKIIKSVMHGCKFWP